MVYPGTLFIQGDNGAFLCIPMKIGVKFEHRGNGGGDDLNDAQFGRCTEVPARDTRARGATAGRPDPIFRHALLTVSAAAQVRLNLSRAPTSLGITSYDSTFTQLGAFGIIDQGASSSCPTPRTTRMCHRGCT
jgi:hypothetical protein